MGPVIIFDKSTLQSLSKEEILFAERYYYLNILPILIFEIVSDLSKTGKHDPEVLTANIASKISPIDSSINVDYREMIVGSLNGQNPPMDGRMIINGGIPLKDSTGDIGVYFEEPPEFKAFRSWQKKKFSEFDHEFAKAFRKYKDSFNLQKLNENALGLKNFWKEVISPETAKEAAMHFVQNNNPDFVIDSIYRFFNIPISYKTSSMRIWQNKGRPPLNIYCPYALHCFSVAVTLIIGISKNIFSSRSSNIIDVEYIYYLPFCNVFATRDNFQLHIAKLFARDDQFIIAGDDLKNDLQMIIGYFSSFSQKDRADYKKYRGNHPPLILNSFTKDIWDKLCIPFDPIKEEALHNLPKEKIFEKIKPMMDAIDKYRSGKHK